MQQHTTWIKKGPLKIIPAEVEKANHFPVQLSTVMAEKRMILTRGSRT